MRPFLIASIMLVGLVADPAPAQLALPPVGNVLRDPIGAVEKVADPVVARAQRLAAQAETLAQQRTDRLARFVRRHSDVIEFDRSGAPARKGELLLLGGEAAMRDALRHAGFVILSQERLDSLDISVTRLGVPAGLPLAQAQALIDTVAPGAEVVADTLHFPAGNVRGKDQTAPAQSMMRAIATRVGMIDGAPANHIGGIMVRGFARGGARAGDHGSAVASLLAASGVRRLLAADVYGDDPAGGNALAIARAIDWLANADARVVTISLVGPDNPLLARAIVAGQRRGIVYVAAVGNDGPAAPPAYPASYPGVLAITAVDGRNRVLIEAGRATHLDYAAPGADMVATNAAGRRVEVRGTSYAAPLAAARAAAALDLGGDVRRSLDAEAQDLGPRGADAHFGRGLLCASCRTR